MHDVLGVRAVAHGTDEASATLAELDRVLRHIRTERIDDTARVRADERTSIDEASVLPVCEVSAASAVARTGRVLTKHEVAKADLLALGLGRVVLADLDSRLVLDEHGLH